MVSLPSGWDLQIDSSVFKKLKKIPKRDVAVLKEMIRLLPADPYFGDIQKMKGEENVWRRRIREYRIFYKIKVAEKMILVFRLERRGSHTY